VTRRLFLIVVPTGLMTAAICFLTLAPHYRFHTDLRVIALLEHVLAYALLMLPTAVLRPGWLHRLWPLAAAMAGAIELAQPQFGRQATLLHFVASCFGIALTTLASLLTVDVREFLRRGAR
jgi:hypothetical protein